MIWICHLIANGPLTLIQIEISPVIPFQIENAIHFASLKAHSEIGVNTTLNTEYQLKAEQTT